MENKEWTMPEWMEKYRDSFNNTGGNSVERLMNNKTSSEVNEVLAVLAIAVSSQVYLLTALKDKELIS